MHYFIFYPIFLTFTIHFQKTFKNYYNKISAECGLLETRPETFILHLLLYYIFELNFLIYPSNFLHFLSYNCLHIIFYFFIYLHFFCIFKHFISIKVFAFYAVFYCFISYFNIKTQKTSTLYFYKMLISIWLRGIDSNYRPSGYEPQPLDTAGFG